jgi:hypothetical protein
MEIESSKLTTCDVTHDGEVIRLNLVDVAGNPVSLRLPFEQAGALAMTMPGLLTRALAARYGKVLATSFPSANGSWRAPPTAVPSSSRSRPRTGSKRHSPPLSTCADPSLRN